MTTTKNNTKNNSSSSLHKKTFAKKAGPGKHSGLLKKIANAAKYGNIEWLSKNGEVFMNLTIHQLGQRIRHANKHIAWGEQFNAPSDDMKTLRELHKQYVDRKQTLVDKNEEAKLLKIKKVATVVKAREFEKHIEFSNPRFPKLYYAYLNNYLQYLVQKGNLIFFVTLINLKLGKIEELKDAWSEEILSEYKKDLYTALERKNLLVEAIIGSFEPHGNKDKSGVEVTDDDKAEINKALGPTLEELDDIPIILDGKPHMHCMVAIQLPFFPDATLVPLIFNEIYSLNNKEYDTQVKLITKFADVNKNYREPNHMKTAVANVIKVSKYLFKTGEFRNYFLQLTKYNNDTMFAGTALQLLFQQENSPLSECFIVKEKFLQNENIKCFPFSALSINMLFEWFCFFSFLIEIKMLPSIIFNLQERIFDGLIYYKISFFGYSDIVLSHNIHNVQDIVSLLKEKYPVYFANSTVQTIPHLKDFNYSWNIFQGKQYTFNKVLTNFLDVNNKVIDKKVYDLANMRFVPIQPGMAYFKEFDYKDGNSIPETWLGLIKSSGIIQYSHIFTPNYLPEDLSYLVTKYNFSAQELFFLACYGRLFLTSYSPEKLLFPYRHIIMTVIGRQKTGKSFRLLNPLHAFYEHFERGQFLPTSSSFSYQNLLNKNIWLFDEFTYLPNFRETLLKMFQKGDILIDVKHRPPTPLSTNTPLILIFNKTQGNLKFIEDPALYDRLLLFEFTRTVSPDMSASSHLTEQLIQSEVFSICRLTTRLWQFYALGLQKTIKNNPIIRHHMLPHPSTVKPVGKYKYTYSDFKNNKQPIFETSKESQFFVKFVPYITGTAKDIDFESDLSKIYNFDHQSESYPIIVNYSYDKPEAYHKAYESDKTGSSNIVPNSEEIGFDIVY